MNPLSLQLLPRALRPFTATATAPSKSTGPAGARTVVQQRRRRLSAASAAVAPRAHEAPSPSASVEERFDWLDQWYPIAPVGELDPGAPHGKAVLGLSVVAWYDHGAGEWRVFEDACPHRLAPLSEGRVDGKGRLQCAYHGWCFNGAGACRFIPQAPALGPPVHKNSRACVASYPSVVQNQVLWFYPRTETEFKDALRRRKKRPPYIKEIDDPSFVTAYGVRDLFYGYDILAENLMDPSHVPYAHKGLIRQLRTPEDPGRVEHDREGGGPIKLKIEEANIDGFLSAMERGHWKFVAPCTFYSSGTSQQERRIAAKGLDNWQTSCYVPASSDTMVVAFRSWFKKYCKNQVGWATPQPDQLPPTPTKDTLMERYWSHVVQCSSCSAALKAMRVLEVALQVASVAFVGFLAVAKETMAMSAARRTVAVAAAVLCFAMSRWLASFIPKNFFFQDYSHAYK